MLQEPSNVGGAIMPYQQITDIIMSFVGQHPFLTLIFIIFGFIFAFVLFGHLIYIDD